MRDGPLLSGRPFCFLGRSGEGPVSNNEKGTTMNKEAEKVVEPIAKKVFDLRAQKKAIEDELKACEQELKGKMNEIGVSADRIGDYYCEIQKIAASKIADVVRLKADGLFEKYSKDKAGYDKLLVSKV